MLWLIAQSYQAQINSVDPDKMANKWITFINLYFGSTGMESVISELCYKWTKLLCHFRRVLLQ